MLDRLLPAVLLLAPASLALGAEPPAEIATPNEELARLVATQVRAAIPLQYDKKVDWGKTTTITTGLRTKGKGLRVQVRRRKKQVDHGLWKHYRLTCNNPEQNLSVNVRNLRPLSGGRAGLTLEVDTLLDAWGRAKAYQYGVHLIALEIVGQAHVRLAVDCQVALKVGASEEKPNLAIDLHVADAHLQLADLRLDRISNARGPLVRELGDGLHKVIQNQLSSAELTDKLNRAIDKRQDRLQIETPRLFSPGPATLDGDPAPAGS